MRRSAGRLHGWYSCRSFPMSERTKPSHQNRMLTGLLKIIALVTVAFFSSGSVSQASCAAQPMTGNWVNINSSARDITRVNIMFTCNDFIAIPSDGPPPPPPPPPFAIEMWGSCVPADCPWGRTSAMASPRAARVTRLIASYNPGFARRSVTLSLSGDTLLVTVFTDFSDPARRDYTMTVRMRRA